LLRRRQVAFKQRQKQLQESVSENDACRDTDSYYDGLDDFQSMLTAYTRYRYVCVIGKFASCEYLSLQEGIVVETVQSALM
jgi:E3 ubiquitin-protein ligase RFWD2